MPPTTNYNFGDIVLVPFPFTDQTTTKHRPSVVVSSAVYHRERPDLILMAITSQVRLQTTVGEVVIHDWKNTGLIKPSVIKPIFTTVERRLVLKMLGHLSPVDQQSLKKVLPTIIGE